MIASMGRRVTQSINGILFPHIQFIVAWRNYPLTPCLVSLGDFSRALPCLSPGFREHESPDDCPGMEGSRPAGNSNGKLRSLRRLTTHPILSTDLSSRVARYSSFPA